MSVLVLVPLASALTKGAVAAGTMSAFAAAGIVTGVGIGAAYLDQTFIYPWLFGKKTPDGPRLEDLRTNSAVEGTPYQFSIGTVRTGGVIIWASDLIETKKKVKISKTQKQNTYSYSVDIAIAFGAGERRITKLWANGKLIYDYNAGTPIFDARYTEIVLYHGSDDQETSALIESYVDTPAYRGTVYCTIQGLQLADFGNGLPQFTAEIAQLEPEEDPHEHGVGIINGLQAIMTYAGWEEEFYDVETALEYSPMTIRGMLITGPTDLAKAIEPIMMRHKLIVRETEGVLEFLPRTGVDTVVVDDFDLGFSENDPQPPYTVTDKGLHDLPAEVNVRYIDPTNNYDQGQKSERSPSAITNGVAVVDLPMVLHPEEARQLARETLWSGFVEAQTFSTVLPPKYMNLQEGDIIDRQMGARTRRVRVTEIERGWNSVVMPAGYFEQANTQVGTTVDYPDPPAQEGPIEVTEPYVHLLDIGPLDASLVNICGIYVAACRAEGQEEWRSVTVYVSGDSGTSYEAVATVSTESTIGDAADALADPPAWDGDTPEPEPYALQSRDDTSELEIVLRTGTLETVTDEQCRNGRNWMLVGNEVIGFVEAELTAPNTYTISKLYRGLMDTQHASFDHADDEVCVLLDESIQFVELPTSKIGTTLHWKGVPMYGDPDVFESFSRNFYGENVKCHRPFDVNSNRDGDIIEVTWNRGSRYPKPALEFAGPADEGNWSTFEISFYETTDDIATDFPLRTETVTLSNAGDFEIDYDTDMQTEDGHTLGDPIAVVILQVGSFTRGRAVYVNDL